VNGRHLYRFGPYALDAGERVLLRDGHPVSLPPKDLEMLLVLVERAGHIVEKEELLGRVWPGVFVEEGNLARHVFNLRQVLGGGGDQRSYIETIPKRGYRFTATLQQDAAEQPAPAATPGPGPSGTAARLARVKGLWAWPLAMSAVLALSAMLASRGFWPQRAPSPPKAMLAVLPFANLSGDASQDYFAEGLTEELIAQLGSLQPDRLGVIARTSTVRYRNTRETAAEIGRELGAGYLLEGSVRRGDGRVRITAQLIRAAEQTHLWADTYERPLTDILNIQREIAEKVTHSLSIRLLAVERDSVPQPPADIESHDKYLLGLHDLGEGTRDSIGTAIEHFQEAIARNPRDGRLHSALGAAYEALNTYYSSPTEVMPRVKAAARQALQLDPRLASAHVLLGDVHLLFDWDWPSAEADYRRALDINPSLADAQLGYATYLATLGRFDEALSRVQQAYLVDPLAIDSRNDALWIYYFSGRMSETVEQCRKAIELEPAAGLPYAMLAMAYAQMGQRADTLRAAEDAVRLANSPSILTTTASALAHLGLRDDAARLLGKALDQARERYVCRFIVAAAYVELGEQEEALQSLQQGYVQRST
jgi:TolB-like protein/DNA-binding winged helix-turn-helix (wHTH) protein/Flp pilus assembly protein TadD